MAAVAPFGAATPTIAAVLSIGLFARAALAHDHHEGEESHIPEGETVSAEPLVSSSVYGYRIASP
jgi:hypothetical protein